MAARARRSPVRSGGFALDRRTLMVDVLQQQQNEKALAKQAEAEAKNEETERWNSAADGLKAAAQQVIDGTMTAAEYAAKIKDAQSQFPTKVGLLASNLTSVVRAGDTQRFNDYASGAITLADLEKYAEDRRGDGGGGGDLDHLKQLMAKAQTDEDTKQYNDYIKDGQTYKDWTQYVQDRIRQGGDLSKLQTLVAQADNNEAKVTDRRQQLSYQSGLLSGGDYEKYLDGRIGSASNPSDLNALRAEKVAVDKNEFVKTVNAVTAGNESGRFSDAEAVSQLRALLGTTTDEGLKAEVLNRIAQYQNKMKASGGGGTGSATQTRIQTQINEMATKAVTEFKDSRTVAINSAKGGGDYKSLSDATNMAFDRLQAALTIARQGSYDNGSDDFKTYNIFLTGLEQERSTTLKGLAIAGADAAAAKISTAATANPVLAAQTRAKYLFDATQDPNISKPDKQGMITEATSGLGTAVEGERTSESGRNAATFVQNRVDEIVASAGEGGVKDLVAKILGVKTADLPNGWSTSSTVLTALGTRIHDKLNSNPGDLYTAFNQSGLKDFQTGQSAANPNGEFATRDAFTKAWNAVNGGQTGEGAANAALFGVGASVNNPGDPRHAGLSPYEQALAQVAGPATALEQARWDAKEAEAGNWRSARASSLADATAKPAAPVKTGGGYGPGPFGEYDITHDNAAAGGMTKLEPDEGQRPLTNPMGGMVEPTNVEPMRPEAAVQHGERERADLTPTVVEQSLAGGPAASLALPSFTPTPEIELAPAPTVSNAFDVGNADDSGTPPDPWGSNPGGGGNGGKYV